METFERLTCPDPIARAWCGPLRPWVPKKKAFSRLVFYEDTGLAPEEITTEKPACVFYCSGDDRSGSFPHAADRLRRHWGSKKPVHHLQCGLSEWWPIVQGTERWKCEAGPDCWRSCGSGGRVHLPVEPQRKFQGRGHLAVGQATAFGCQPDGPGLSAGQCPGARIPVCGTGAGQRPGERRPDRGAHYRKYHRHIYRAA